MLAHDRVGSLGEAERVLELSSRAEHRRPAFSQGNRGRHVAAAPPHHAHPSGNPEEHGVVAPLGDGAVMHQEGVGETRKAFERFGVLRRERLVAQVGAGHDQHLRPITEKQVVQGRIGKHHPEPGVAGGYGWSDGEPVALAKEHDGS